MKEKFLDIRQHILDCGQRLIAARGFVGVGLTEILNSAGVPKGSFYHYFASKELYGDALLESYFAGYLQRMDALLNQEAKTGAERLCLYLLRWIEIQGGDDDSGKCLIVKLAAEVADLSDAMRSTMLKGTNDILARLAACIAAGQGDGSILNPRAAPDLALWLYETWLGASLLAKLRRDDSTLDSALAATREMLGLK